MDEERIKQAVLSVLERTGFARELARAVEGARQDGRELGATGATGAEPAAASAASLQGPTPGTQKLLTRIVLGDILDDAILSARPQDRTFPLRLLFSELGSLLASDREDGAEALAAEQAFTLACGLNFFFRAPMEEEAKVRVGLEVSRQLYTLAHEGELRLDAEVVAKAAPLLAAIMSSDLGRVRLESIDHTRVFDSSIHERTSASDPTGSRILRPASFLCRVSTNQAVKAKAQVVT